ncbi:hypothetical protein JCM12298_29730 [Desulfothermus naphthae]
MFYLLIEKSKLNKKDNNIFIIHFIWEFLCIWHDAVRGKETFSGHLRDKGNFKDIYGTDR